MTRRAEVALTRKNSKSSASLKVITMSLKHDGAGPPDAASGKGCCSSWEYARRTLLRALAGLCRNCGSDGMPMPIATAAAKRAYPDMREAGPYAEKFETGQTSTIY